MTTRKELEALACTLTHMQHGTKVAKRRQANRIAVESILRSLECEQLDALDIFFRELLEVEDDTHDAAIYEELLELIQVECDDRNDTDDEIEVEIEWGDDLETIKKVWVEHSWDLTDPNPWCLFIADEHRYGELFCACKDWNTLLVQVLKHDLTLVAQRD